MTTGSAESKCVKDMESKLTEKFLLWKNTEYNPIDNPENIILK
jgi:hypothetical protein